MTGSWEAFQRKHIQVDRECLGWNRDRWNDWLRQRAAHEYGTRQRSINSVIVTTPQEIVEDFRTLGTQYGNQYYWSRNMYRIFYLKLTRHELSPYSVRDLGQMHFCAAVGKDNEGRNVPIHFHRQSPGTPSRGNVNVDEKNFPEME